MKLREYLEENGLRHNFVANKIGCSQAMLTNIITGQRMPNLMLALQIQYFTKGQVNPEDWIPEEEISIDRLLPTEIAPQKSIKKKKNTNAGELLKRTHVKSGNIKTNKPTKLKS